MKWILFICTFALFASAEEAKSVRSLTLQQSYALALDRSESLGIRREELKTAEAQYWQAISAILPKVNFIASEEIQNSPFSSGGGSSSSTSRTSNGRRDRFAGTAQATMTIFNGFREFHAVAGIRAQERSKAALIDRERQLLYLNTSDLFYQVLGYEKDLGILQKINGSLKDRHQDLVSRIALGRSRKSELLAAETDLAENQTTIEQVRGLLGATRELFAFLIGIPANRFELQSSRELPPIDKLETYLWKTGVRPDVVSSREEQTVAERNLSISKGAFLPTMDVTANHYTLEEPKKIQDWNIIVTAEVPIFDGGLRLAQLSEKKSLVRASALNFSRAQRLADSEVRQAYNNFTSSAQQLVQLHHAVETSRKNYEAQKEDYQLGRANNLDVLTALVQLGEFERRLNRVELQNQTNLVALQVAAGEPANSTAKKESPQP